MALLYLQFSLKQQARALLLEMGQLGLLGLYLSIVPYGSSICLLCCCHIFHAQSILFGQLQLDDLPKASNFDKSRSQQRLLLLRGSDT